MSQLELPPVQRWRNQNSAPKAVIVPPGRQPELDERFVFQPHASNPEVWRTTVPLVVRQHCKRHKGLIATWTAIHWLIVLYAASGRCAFGMREIAKEAGVGRNELAGAYGYIQRLVDLGLITIVGYERVPGVKEPRPIYQIDMADLERQSIDLVPTMLYERRLPPPPRPTPDPRQLALFATDEQKAVEALPENSQPVPVTGTGQVPPTRHMGMPHPQMPENTPAVPEIGTVAVTDSRFSGQSRLAMPEIGTVPPETGTDHARNRDVERMNERMNEGVSEIAPTHDKSIHLIAAQAAQAVILLLRQQGMIPIQSSVPSIPDAPSMPENQPALPSDMLTLWQGDRATLPARERYQLTMLANELDPPTSGYGAYWVGRAILVADRCLGERGQPLSLNYLRGMLRRWQREGSWGSDLEFEREALAAPPARPANGTAALIAVPPSQGTAALAPTPLMGELSAPPSAALPLAVARYQEAFGHQPNSVQAQQIAETVSNITVWDRVLTDWQAHNWRADSVPKMLDRYRTLSSTAPDGSDSTPKPSLLEIYEYPDIEDSVRQRWLYRFSHAGPAERIAIMVQFRKEYP